MPDSSALFRWPALFTALVATSFAPAAPMRAGGLGLGRLETSITDHGPDFSSGEPQIAINPTNPDNLYIAYATFPVPIPPGNFGPAPDHSCGGYVSMDRGETWQPSFIPFPTQSPVTFSQCEDGMALFGPDGTLYAGGDAANEIRFLPPAPPPAEPCPPEYAFFGAICVRPLGNDPFARSTDGGSTWTLLPHPMGSPEWCPTCNFAPGSGTPYDAYDRPFLAVDESTGHLYFTARNILPPNERFVTVSFDKGDSFEPIYAVDSPIHPQGASSSNIAVAKGVLAEAYLAQPAPGGCSSTCLIFETSTDYGATWKRHVVPLVDAAATPRAHLAAFPGYLPQSTPQFALTVLDSTGTQNQVYTTRDLGETWQGPTLVAATPANAIFKPWLSYGPLGELVLIWRTWEGTPNDPTTPYQVWAAVGVGLRLHGPLFSGAKRVSSVAAPYGTGGGGDDLSFIASDGRYAHAGWGDTRSGATEVWYSRIPLLDLLLSGH